MHDASIQPEFDMTIRFSINRTCAPQLSLPGFIDLAVAVGVSAVEIRNDIPDREFMDGTPAEDIMARLRDAKLNVASVNALQRFNDWSKDREREARHIVGYAAQLGAPGVVLCPVHNPDHGWSGADAEKNLRSGLKQLRPILLDLGVTGYVEPLGMTGSTMKMQGMAVAAIDDIGGWDAYQLCYDTFQFFRCGDTKLFPERIGLAHMSGIVRDDLTASELTEPDRVLVEHHDRVDNIRQLRELKATGYGGYVSMEPFNPEVQRSADLAKHLRASLARVADALK
jgi:2-keto-myo-inositol isomerase